MKQVLKAFDRFRYGRRTEKQGSRADTDLEEQGAFVFEEIETGIAAIKALVAKGRSAEAAKRAPRPRKGFAPHLERIHVVIEPDDLPEHAGKEKILIGEDTCERLDVIAAKFRVIVTHRPKYAFKNEDGIIQALTPAHIIESGIATEALLAQIAVSKYGDGLPLYRQEAIFLRDQVEVAKDLMARWMGRVSFELEILADYTFAQIKQGERIFADETTLPTLVSGSGSAKTAYLWAYARDDRPFGGSGPPLVAYRFEDSRSGDCVARHLDGYRGILQVDGYVAYNRLARPDRGHDGVLLAGCWAHSRRLITSCTPATVRRSQRQRSNRWASSGRLKRKFVARARKRAWRRARKPLLRSSQISLNSGRTHCRASPASQSSPMPSAMHLRDARPSSASWLTAASKSIPTLSSGQSDPKL